MSRDVPSASAHTAGPSTPPLQSAALELQHEFSWTLVERGSFMFGRCDECAFATPARRARYSVDADMGAHAVICHANRTVDVDEVRAEVQHTSEPAGVPG